MHMLCVPFCIRPVLHAYDTFSLMAPLLVLPAAGGDGHQCLQWPPGGPQQAPGRQVCRPKGVGCRRLVDGRLAASQPTLSSRSQVAYYSPPINTTFSPFELGEPPASPSPPSHLLSPRAQPCSPPSTALYPHPSSPPRVSSLRWCLADPASSFPFLDCQPCPGPIRAPRSTSDKHCSLPTPARLNSPTLASACVPPRRRRCTPPPPYLTPPPAPLLGAPQHLLRPMRPSAGPPPPPGGPCRRQSRRLPTHTTPNPNPPNSPLPPSASA